MSIKIEENIALAPMTTMRVGGKARFFVAVQTEEELGEAIAFAHKNDLPIFILGGGANTVVSENGFPGLVIKIEMNGIAYEGTRVVVGAGERWDDVVQGAVENNLWGIENLSLVPGTAGGAIVQNIGAYGVEVRDSVFSVDALDIEKMQIITFLNEECEFGYRESVFKKNKNLVVLRIVFNLSNTANPNTNYADVKKYFEDIHIINPSLADIRDAIVAIRTAKMPMQPLGSAGSFFKNPVIDRATYETLKKQFPEMQAYLQGENMVKLSAAWLIDHIGGFRGIRRGNVGVHEKQALILVNYGNARAEEIFALAHEIQNDIKEKTNVMLEAEVVMM